MDNNKLKFADRLKALLKTESRQDVDPYVFSEPEPFATAGKNFKLMQPKNARSVVTPATAFKNTKSSSKGKCIERRIKSEGSATGGRIAAPICFETTHDELRGQDESDVDPFDNTRSHAVTYPGGRDRGLVGENSCDMDNRVVDVSRRRGSDSSERRSYNRDHTLLYYPRAGDEISDSESSGDELSVYQRHWFTDVTSDGASLNRTARLSQLRSQLRRRLIQLHKGGQESEILLRERTRYLLEEAASKEAHESSRRDETRNSRSLNRELSNEGGGSAGPLLVGGPCGMDGCRQTSLPCTRHCSRHIMLNADQLLFEHCTAKFSDNTQCCVPVFDVAHELPLCPEHARKRDNYHRKAQESKPKKSRKKPVSPVVPRPKSKSRPKKRKRPPSIKLETKISGFVHDDDIHYSSQIISMHDNDAKTLNNLNVPPPSVPQSLPPPSLPSQCSASNSTNFNLGLGLGSLGLGAVSGSGASLKVELGDHEVFASLDPAEHDFGNVLNNLPADAFNDIFIESRNGEYEPSREEEEELERALEAVDKDVRNLERMGQTHGLLEPALLAQLMSDIAS